MNNKMYIVLATDVSDTADCTPHEVFRGSHEEALEYVRQDMRDYTQNMTVFDEETNKELGPRVFDEVKMYMENYDGSWTCQWTIIEVSENH